MLQRLLALLPFARYQVSGRSMAPTYSPGERLIVSRAAYWFSGPRPGDPVVVRDPRQRDRLLLKRIDGTAGAGRWTIRGDNPRESTDSRQFGPVGRELILGKVWLSY